MPKIGKLAKRVTNSAKRVTNSAKSAVGLGGYSTAWVLVGVLIIAVILLCVFLPRCNQKVKSMVGFRENFLAQSSGDAAKAKQEAEVKKVVEINTAIKNAISQVLSNSQGYNNPPTGNTLTPNSRRHLERQLMLQMANYPGWTSTSWGPYSETIKKAASFQELNQMNPQLVDLLKADAEFMKKYGQYTNIPGNQYFSLPTSNNDMARTNQRAMWMTIADKLAALKDQATAPAPVPMPMPMPIS